MTDKEQVNSGDWNIPDSQIPEFDIDTRKRLIDHEVIEFGHLLQMQFDQHAVTSDKFEETWQTLIPSVEVLDRKASQSGLLGLKAGVRGHNIALPMVEMDFGRGKMTIAPMSDAERQEELVKSSLDTDEICGPFSGYSLRFRRNLEMPDTYTPQLVYQISLREIGRQHAFVMPVATGDVGISKLFFEADERLDTRKDILERLFSAVSEHGDKADKINRTLAEAEWFDDKVLCRVGYDADKLVGQLQGDERQHTEDALCELIENYIDFSLRSDVMGDGPMLLSLDTTTQPIKYLEGLQEIQSGSMSIEFFDWPVKVAGGSARSRRRCCLTVDQGDTLTVVPLVKVRRFN